MRKSNSALWTSKFARSCSTSARSRSISCNSVKTTSQDEIIPSPSFSSEAVQSRRKRASEGLAFAEKRLALAELLLKGNFPEEMSRPLRESLGWAITSLLALHTDRDPAADLPSPRLIHAELVERGHIPIELSQKLAQVRDLTAPPDPGEDTPPLSQQAGQTLLDSVREMVALAQEQIVKAGI